VIVGNVLTLADKKIIIVLFLFFSCRSSGALSGSRSTRPHQEPQMNNPTEDYTPDIEQDTREWLPLDTARNTFTGLVTGPDPLAIDGRDFPGLPPRSLPLDDLRDRLLDRACPLHIRDAVWRHLIQRARDEGATWMVACVGVALPGLAGTARWLAARYRGDRADVHAVVLSGFVEALASVDLSDPGVLYRLQWAARRAGQAALEESLDAPVPSATAFESRAPRTPYGHQDLVLARAVGDGVLTPTEADLISATRVGDESVTDWAHAHGRSVHAVAKARERAEHRLFAYLTDPDQLASGPESDDPVADAALRGIAISKAAGSPGAHAPDPADLSLAVSGRRRNGRPTLTGKSKKSSRLVSKNTPKSGLLGSGEITP
jgi:hypothetical protein